MRFVIILIFLSVVIGCQSSEQSSQTSQVADSTSQQAEADQWIILFDGSDTDQWRGYLQEEFPQQGWEIQGDELVLLKTPEGGTGGGDIITKEKYRNFELTLEFMATDTANSGIFYLAQELEGEPIFHSAPEYQILDDQTYISMGEMDMNTHLTGDNYDLQAADERYSNPVGSWNNARIVVNDGHVEHWLNGNKTIEYQINSDEWKELVNKSKFSEMSQYAQAESGYIGLQDHGHEVRFRNIKIRKL